jgi:hypothetical protein
MDCPPAIGESKIVDLPYPGIPAFINLWQAGIWLTDARHPYFAALLSAYRQTLLQDRWFIKRRRSLPRKKCRDPIIR